MMSNDVQFISGVGSKVDHRRAEEGFIYTMSMQMLLNMFSFTQNLKMNSLLGSFYSSSKIPNGPNKHITFYFHDIYLTNLPN